MKLRFNPDAMTAHIRSPRDSSFSRRTLRQPVFSGGQGRPRRRRGYGGLLSVKHIAVVMFLAPEFALAHLSSTPAGELNWLDLDWLAFALLGLMAGLYLRGSARLGMKPQADPQAMRKRQVCFWAGWLTVFIALCTPLDALAEQLFSAHMVQHELLMLVAAPLWVLSKPLAQLLRGSPAWTSRVFSAVARHRVGLGIWTALVAPPSAWLIHLVVLWVWHIPALFEAGLNNNAVHSLQHLSFLFAALLFWWVLLRNHQFKHQALGGFAYLFSTSLHAGLLGALLTLSPRAWYHSYEESAPYWGLTGVEDQQIGGLIMWMPGGITYLVIALVLLARFLSSGPSLVKSSAPRRSEV